MSFTVNALQNPTDAEIEQLVQLCVRAYTPAETSVKTIIDGNFSLLDGFFRASIRAGALGGDIHVATEGADSNMIRGMALWWGPGVEPFSTSVFTSRHSQPLKPGSSDDQRRELYSFVSRLSVEAQEWHRTTYRPEFANLTEKLLGPQGKLDSWYLNLLAVDPNHRRQGVARALIDAVRTKATSSELVLAATNELSVDIYRRLGFSVRGSMIMSGPQGEFPVFVLSRSSADAGTTE
ncbi:hypothetical protein C8R45DRAFT_1204575 [Mycena sanguinolenta]|nr:hypothetical protein C8R45DRAFT_1204575 [Mycena sanguinolenta]